MLYTLKKSILVYLLLIAIVILGQNLAHADWVEDATDDELREIVTYILTITKNSCDSKGYIELPKTQRKADRLREYFDAVPPESRDAEVVDAISEDYVRYYCFTTVNSTRL